MGGNAISETSKLDRKNLSAVLEDFFDKFPFLKLDKVYHQLVGSSAATDKPLLGDVDIAFDKTIFDIEAFNSSFFKIPTLEYVLNKLKNSDPDLEFYLNRGSDIISIGHYYSPLGEKYQIDIILSSNINFTSWMLYSPSKSHSIYKGLYRNSLISACTHFLEKEIHSQGLLESRYLLNYSTGLYRIMQRTTNERTGKILKNPKEVDRIFITKNPNKIVSLIFFGSTFYDNKASKLFRTFEETFQFLEASQSKIEVEAIVKRHIQYLNKNKYEIPKEYAKFDRK